MPKIIHVPQGFSARLMNTTQSYGIDALYTDGFSTCNIVVCIGSDRIMLAHVDVQALRNPQKIKEEIDWVGEGCQILIMSRGQGATLKGILLDYLHNNCSLKNIVEKEIDNQHDGIYVSLTRQIQATIHPNVINYAMGDKPPELIRHPQEQQLLMVQKIEQVVGMLAIARGSKLKQKQFCLFDGGGWEPLSKTELELNTSSIITRRELALFDSNQPFMNIASNLADIVTEVEKVMPVMSNLAEMVLPTCIYMETYLNNNDYALLLKRNLKQLVNDDDYYRSVAKEDSLFRQALGKVVNKSGDVYNEVVELIDKYEHQTTNTEFKKPFLAECKAFLEHYQSRKLYEDLKVSNQELATSALRYNQQAVKLFGEKNYQGAANLFLESIKILTQCSLKSTLVLSAAYYNCGRSLYMAEDYKMACFYLKTSVMLKENYTDPRPQQQELEKTRKALQECEQKLSIKTDENHKLQIMTVFT